jgi:hypothetical protein
MTRSIASFLLAAIAIGQPVFNPPVTGICQLAEDFPRYKGRLVAVRGIYYYGLRQNDCKHQCEKLPLPAFIDLGGGNDNTWTELDRTFSAVEQDAKNTGKRFEIWVTAVGTLATNARRSPLGPCDRVGGNLGGFGHLGAYPARLTVKSFRDIEVKENPKSLYDYGHMYHGPL